MKVVYCSKCGTCLAVTRKALPKYGKIINIINPHECPDEPIELNLTPVEIPSFGAVEEKGENTFVQNLNGLLSSTTGTDNLVDRRKAENVKGESSSAPRMLLDNIESMHNTAPANDIKSDLGE